MIGDVPEGWAEARLDSISSSIQYGYTASANQEAKGPRLLRITDIQNGRVDWHTVPGCEIDPEDVARYSLTPGDIVFARSGATTGKSYLVRDCPKNAVFASYLIRVRVDRAIALPEFLNLFFQSKQYWDYISDNLAGNAQPNCSGTKLAALLVQLPPIAEQRSIVDKVEALLQHVNRTKARLDRVLQILRQFRQAVLDAAYSGRLTEDWRKQCDAAIDVDNESRISKEPSDRLPVGWREVPLDQLRQPERPIIYGIIKPGPHVPDGVPYVRVVEMKDGRIDVASLRRASHARAAQFRRAVLQSGDLLVSKDGTIGRVAVVPLELEGGNITQHLVRVSPRADISRDYLVWAIRSPAVQKWLTTERKGVALQGVNVEDFRRVPIPLAPRKEQDEVVRRIGALFTLADRINQAIETAVSRTNILTQAILSKAFRGELVPTEAELARAEGRTYETAEELLARVRQQNETEDGNRVPKGRRSRAR